MASPQLADLSDQSSYEASIISSEGSYQEESAMFCDYDWTCYSSLDEQKLDAERKANRRAEKAARSKMELRAAEALRDLR